MQQIVLKDVTCLTDSTLNNESEFQARVEVQKHIDKFNKESLKNTKQAGMTNKNLLVCFVNKKRLLHIYKNVIYEYNSDNNVLKFSYKHYGMDRLFIIKVTTKTVESEQEKMV